MSWAKNHIKLLLEGKSVCFKPKGNSMLSIIKSGQLCFINPIFNHKSLRVGDIVLCKVKGSHYLHLIKAIKDKRFQISNNRGKINGWVSKNAIYGRYISPEKYSVIKRKR